VKEMHDIGIDAVLLIYSTKFEVARWIARHCWYRLGSEGVGWGPYQDYSESPRRRSPASAESRDFVELAGVVAIMGERINIALPPA
jgi:hypothetical protein